MFLFAIVLFAEERSARLFSLIDIKEDENISMVYTGSFEGLSLALIDYLRNAKYTRVGDIPDFLEYENVYFGGIYRKDNIVFTLILFSHHQKSGDIFVPDGEEIIASSLHVEFYGVKDSEVWKKFYNEHMGKPISGGKKIPDLAFIKEYDRKSNLNSFLRAKAVGQHEIIRNTTDVNAEQNPTPTTKNSNPPANSGKEVEPSPTASPEPTTPSDAPPASAPGADSASATPTPTPATFTVSPTTSTTPPTARSTATKPTAP